MLRIPNPSIEIILSPKALVTPQQEISRPRGAALKVLNDGPEIAIQSWTHNRMHMIWHQHPGAEFMPGAPKRLHHDASDVTPFQPSWARCPGIQ